MASIGHIAVGMAAARLYRTKRRPLGATLASFVLWSSLAMLPDADVIGFRLGVRYGAEWGHRGASHSLALAVLVGSAIGLLAPLFGGTRLRTALFAIVTLASHGLLDTLTDGGRGCALFWPFDLHRHFAPFRPIPVAPIGAAFFSRRGLQVALAELVLFSPFFIYASWPRKAR